MSIVIDSDSLQFTIKAIGNVNVSMRRAGKAAVQAAGKALAKQVKHNVSSRDHTLEQLAAMDHPYAVRHGQITAIHGARSGGTIRDARHIIHKRSGDMARSVRSAFRQTGSGGAIAWDVWFDLGVAPHIREVLEGTPTMLPRDPLWETAMGPSMIVAMRKAIVLELGKRLRSQATIRFGGSP